MIIGPGFLSGFSFLEALELLTYSPVAARGSNMNGARMVNIGTK